MNHPQKGSLREKELDKNFYFEAHYFKQPQLYSLAYQLNLIYSLRPKNLFEVGIGNGFVSDLFKKSGLDVTTFDINPELKPDIVGNLLEIDKTVQQKYDLVVCSEVLEHLPFEQFDDCLKNLKTITQGRLLLTLPSCRRYLIDYHTMIKLPKTDPFYFQFKIPFGKRPICEEHFWELFSDNTTKLPSILDKISKHFKVQEQGVVQFNSFHHYFILTPL